MLSVCDLKNFYLFLFYLCGCFACYAPSVCSAQGGQRRALDSLELELWTVSLHVGAGYTVEYFCRHSLTS